MMFYCLGHPAIPGLLLATRRGSNGKSVYLHVLRHLLGVNSVSAVPLERLGARFQTAALMGRRANLAVDVHELTKLHEAPSAACRTARRYTLSGSLEDVTTTCRHGGFSRRMPSHRCAIEVMGYEPG